MAEPPFDAQERLELCDLFAELGPFVPTLLEGWTANDLAAHIVLRERDLIAGPCIALPGPFQRFAETAQGQTRGEQRLRVAGRRGSGLVLPSGSSASDGSGPSRT